MTRGAVLAALTLAGGFAAAPAHAALGPRYGGELKVTLADDAGSPFVVALAHEGLLRLGGDGSLQPRLAREWAPGPAPGEWTLTLEPDLQFHDGTSIAAAPVVRVLRRFLRGPTTAARVLAERLVGGDVYRRGETEELTSIVADDERHVRLRFSAPTSLLDLLPLTAPAAAIVSERDAGSGPFVPTVATGDERLFVAFGGHVHGRPYLDRVRVRLTADVRRAMADLRLGRAHIAPVADRPGAARRVLLLALDAASPAFATAAARARVAVAVDREVLARRVLENAEPWDRLLADDGTGVGTPPKPRGEEATPLAGDVTLAVDRALPPLISQRMVAHLSALGLTVRVLATSAAEVRSTPADARLFLFEPEISEPALALVELALLAPRLSEAAVAAALETDPRRRRELAQGVETRLLEDRTLLPLARVGRGPAVADVVHGLVPAADILRLEDVWLEP